MTAAWKIQTEAWLLRDETPQVLRSSDLHAIACNQAGTPPSGRTFDRWLHDMAQANKLVEVIKGVYLNRMRHPNVSPAAAAQHIRARSVVSLAWVLEQAGVTNNFGDVITCVIPTDPSWTNPQIGTRTTSTASFRFFAMPARLVIPDGSAKELDDFRDHTFDYPRATPEKALLDWIYLGASPRSRMTRPPMDLDLTLLNRPRLRRLSRRMDIEVAFKAWQEEHAAYQTDPEVQENRSLRFNL
jgi:hypothetical protein